MTRRSRFSQEVRERAVRMVIDHGAEYDSRWEAITSIAEKIGCAPETLRKWLLRAEVDSGRAPKCPFAGRRLKIRARGSVFATVRLRQRVTRDAGSRQMGLLIVFQLLAMAERRWRRINAPRLLPLVCAGVGFWDGLAVDRSGAERAA